MTPVSMPMALFAAFCLSAQAAAYSFQTVENRSDLNSTVCNAAEVPDSLAVGDVVDLSLPEGVAFSLSIVAAPPAGIAGQSFIARDQNSEASAVVKPTKDGLRVAIDDFEHGKVYSVRVKDGVVTSSVRDVSGADGGDVCGTCAAAGGAAPPSSDAPDSSMSSSGGAVSTKPAKSGARMLAGASETFPLAEHNPVVDILVAFDRGAKAWVENGNRIPGDTIEEFADYAVSKMNTVLEKSQLLDKFSYRLVGVVEVDDQWTTILESGLLDKLRTRSGALSKIGELREKYGADTITLLIDRDINQSGTSGQGYEYASSYTAATFDKDNYACNVCDVKTVHERYTMSHETGHNMGCGHSNRYASSPGRYSYSYGYNFVDANNTNRYTVMAYDRTSPASGTYLPIPYFSTPDISPAEYGCALGEEGVNDNRRTLINTHADIAGLREHVVPYDWDVRFLDDDGNDIQDGSYFYTSCYVTLTNSNPNAEIYYTLDGSTPTKSSFHGGVGTKVYMYLVYGPRTLTACAVVDGVSQSVLSITLRDGLTWSGDADGAGLWTPSDATARPWSGECFYGDAVVFPDLAGVSSATVTVQGAVSPSAAAFVATDTSYVFEGGDDAALISLPDASFAPKGDLTFNVPVKMDAAAFTNPANHTVAFNAPFGQTVTETTGYCTNFIGIGSAGTLVVAPGAGRTQTFDHFSNVNWFYNNAKIRVGCGTVVFKGPTGSKGLFGSTQMEIAKDGRVVLDMSSASSDPFYTSVVSGEGTVEYRAVLTSNASRWKSSSWKGTVAFDGLVAGAATQNFQFENYGNADSRILLRNCAISYLKDNNATFPGTLVLDGADAFSCGNGYSGKYNVFGALEGAGSMSFSGSPTHAYVFNVATNYTGSITVNASSGTGRRIVFGTVAAASDIPSQSATITVKPGAAASIGGGATWFAHHGVEIGGTLLVKGADATLDCNASAATGIKLDDGATLRFETAGSSLVFAKAPSFASGTNYIAFASGVAPTNGMVLARWPDGSSVPAGDFAFADSSLAARWALSKTATGLVVENAPLPVTVRTSITARYWGDDGWENRELDFDLPTAWITNYYPTLETISAVAAKYDEDAANGAKVWQCYMLGLDPTDASSGVSLAMTVESGKIRFAVEGLGETHELAGINVYWYMKTSTNLVTDASFSKTRDSAQGLPPTFGVHDMPDKPTGKTTEPVADTLFYKISVSFVAEDGD